MSFASHFNDVNLQEDFEEAIARNIKEEFDNESEGEQFFLNFLFSLLSLIILASF